MIPPQASLGDLAADAADELLLPKPPGIIRRFWARHPWVLDSLIAGFYFLIPLGMAAAAGFPGPVPAPSWVMPAGIGVGLASTTAILLRRHRPWAVFAFVCLTTLAGWGPLGILDVAAIPIALFALAVYRSTRDAWIGFAVAVAIGTASAYLIGALHGQSSVPPLAGSAAASSGQFAVILLIVTLIGINLGNRKRYLAALLNRAAQLARERDQQAHLASTAERARIAREMHDIVSHSLSVMVTLSDGSAAAVKHAPAQAAESMRDVAETGRNALLDMHRMLGLLSEQLTDPQPTQFAPQPGVVDLPQLVRIFRTAGLPVALEEAGAPPTDAAEQLTVYRIVQESLTNVLRHATHPTAVVVKIHYRATGTSLDITDNGQLPITLDAVSIGRGLLGMRERVALYGGTIQSGPCAGSGWRVRATLPNTPGTSR